MIQDEHGRFPHRDATPAELHACTGGMGPAASKLAFGQATRGRTALGSVRAGLNIRAVRRQSVPAADPAPSAGGVCGPNGCTG